MHAARERPRADEVHTAQETPGDDRTVETMGFFRERGTVGVRFLITFYALNNVEYELPETPVFMCLTFEA